jgi:hypothetical protein
VLQRDLLRARPLCGCDGVLGVSGGAEGVFDVVGDGVDELGELGDGFEGAVFAPAGDVGHGLAGDVGPEAAEHEQRRGVDDDFGRAGVLL